LEDKKGFQFYLLLAKVLALQKVEQKTLLFLYNKEKGTKNL
jgi:hypothetical protein